MPLIYLKPIQLNLVDLQGKRLRLAYGCRDR